MDRIGFTARIRIGFTVRIKIKILARKRPVEFRIKIHAQPKLPGCARS